MGVYATVEDIADFLRMPIDNNSSPNEVQVEKLIGRNEDRIDRRTGHAWRPTQVVKEIHDLPLLYTFGWGTPVFLQHRNLKVNPCDQLCANQGDAIEIWQGTTGDYREIVADNSLYEVEPIYGRLFIRGFLFSILRKHRLRITYRYGDAVVPGDIKDACIKLTAVDIIRSSFRMDVLPIAQGINPYEMSNEWKRDADKIIRDREEIFFIP